MYVTILFMIQINLVLLNYIKYKLIDRKALKVCKCTKRYETSVKIPQ